MSAAPFDTNAMSAMSDTPRTDAEVGKPYTNFVPADFARQLERELQEKTERVKELALLANNRLEKLEKLQRQIPSATTDLRFP